MNEQHIALLENVVTIADLVLDPKPNIGVPECTLRELRAEVEEARRMPCEDSASRIINDEAVMLTQAVQNVVLYRLDQASDRAERWGYLAGALLAFVRTDVAKHKVAAS